MNWRAIIAAWRAIFFGGWIEDWRGDFDNVTGAPYGWDDSEVPPSYPNRLQLDSITTRHNRGQSLRAQILDGDPKAHAGNGTAVDPEPHERAEVALGVHLDSEGDLRKYEWSTYFDATYPTPDKFNLGTWWQVFAQWHQDADPAKPFYDHTPPVQMHVNDATTMKLKLTDSSGVETETPLGDMNRGSWHDFSAEIQWSSNPQLGYVSIQVDGNSPLFIPGATMYPGNPTVYWKLGLYRLEGSGSGTATVYHDEAVRLRRIRRLWPSFVTL
jgi:hypothetical protein